MPTPNRSFFRRGLPRTRVAGLGVVVLTMLGALVAQVPRTVAASVALPADPGRGSASAVVAFTQPGPDTRFVAPAEVELTAAVPGNTVQVDFFVNASRVGSSREWPFTVTWANVPAGHYTLVAVAHSARGIRATSPALPVVIKDARELPLVQKSTLRWLGAFRLPTGKFGGSSFGYNGPIAYNPDHDSLFVVGHDWQQQVAEVTIPELRRAATLEGYPVARVLQPFADPTDGRSAQVNPGDPNPIKVGGLLPWNGALVVSDYAYYDGGGRQTLSHFVAGQNLASSGEARGPFRVAAPMAGLVSGYMAPVPKAWQAAIGAPAVTGQCCIAIVSRTSFGPALFAFDPAHVGVKNPIPATPLVYYPESNPTLGNWGDTSPLYNGSTKITGVVFPEGTRSVLFFGRQGMGRFCYGTGAECKDPMYEDKGVHAYPYVYQVWAYDAAELVQVKRRDRQPWSVRPYAVWQMEFPAESWASSVTGATYDPETGRLFVAQGFVEGGLPLIHVYDLDLK